MNEERSVGFINHEIKIRGKNNLQSASTKMVINKCVDLLVAVEPGEHYKYRKPAQEVKDIKLKWRTMVQSHQQDAYQEKDKIRLKDESTRYTLLEELKAENGPFTNSEEIEQYFYSDAPDDVKNTRLYKEVRYARFTSTSLKPTAAVLRLKRNYKNLESQEYYDNLTSYLSNVRSIKTLTLSDLKNVLHCLANKNAEPDNSEIETEINKPDFVLGEHVIAFWVNTNSVKQWYLGIVEKIEADGLIISYLTQASRSSGGDQSWTFPEEAEVLKTSYEQILASQVKVQYSGSVRIRCKILDASLLLQVNHLIQQ